MSKLPPELRIELHRRNGSSPWTLSNLREYFKEEVQAREMSSRAFGAPSQEPTHFKGSRGEPSYHRVSVWHDKQGTASALVSSDKGGFKSNRPNYVETGKYCHFCRGNHYCDQCREFPDVNSRCKMAKSHCYSCLGAGHMRSSCSFKRKCFYCGLLGHHRSLCRKKFSNTNQQYSSSTDGKGTSSKGPVNVTENMLVQGCRVVLQTALANVKGRHLARQARLLFDNGADNAFIKTSLARQIGADCIGRDTISLAGFQATRRARSCCNIYRFDIMLQNGDCFTVKAYGTDQITCPIDKYAFDTTANPILTEVTLAEPLSQVNTHVPVDILLGSDYYYKILNTDKQPIVLNSGLVLLDSKLGYIVGGSIDSDGSGRTSLLLNRGLSASYEDDSGVQSLWRLEAIGIKEPYDSYDDQLALKNFNETVEFDDVDQRYQVKWPWNGKEGELPVNYNIAFGRLKALMRSLDDDPNLKVKYIDHTKDQLSKGIIEETGGDAANGSVTHYMPHRFVVTPDKTTTKLRIVYDGSSRSRQEALSLNDCMYRGPVIFKDICSLLLRFRLHRIGITSDLEKAFLQIGIQEPDRDAVRFLWLKDVDKPVTPDNLQHYRFRRVCFGVVASPFLLGATLVHHLDQVGSSVASEVKESLL